MKKLKKNDSSCFIGKSCFENYLVFQPIQKYFKRISSDYILSWKSKGLSYENIEAPFAPNNFLNPSLEYLDTKARVKFSGSCLNKNASTYNHRKSVNIYIVYKANKMATQQAVIQNYKTFYLEQLL